MLSFVTHFVVVSDIMYHGCGGGAAVSSVYERERENLLLLYGGITWFNFIIYFRLTSYQ
jgi:hypothetical protein